MLSRVADSLYWMSRYLERAEHIARLLGVNLHQMLDQTPDRTDHLWRRMLLGLRLTDVERYPSDAYAITRALTFDASNPASVVACIAVARENARQVRESISSEMWEHLNRLYLRVRRTSMDEIWSTEPHEFFQVVKEGSHLFQGITDATISHDEGWHFIQIGRFIERAGSTAALLDIYFRELDQRQGPSAVSEYLEWVTLLKSCTAFESYCRVYSADLHPIPIAEFLLLNATSPRSVRFAADRIQHSLHTIARETGLRTAGRAERLAGRLSAALDYGQVDEIMALSLHDYLTSIQQQCAGIHTAVHQIYIDYPVETLLAQ